MVLTRTPDPPPPVPYILRLNVITQKRKKGLISNGDLEYDL